MAMGGHGCHKWTCVWMSYYLLVSGIHSMYVCLEVSMAISGHGCYEWTCVWMSQCLWVLGIHSMQSLGTLRVLGCKIVYVCRLICATF